MVRARKKVTPERLDALRENLRNFIYYCVGKDLEKLGESRKLLFTKEIISMISEITLLQLKVFVKDMVAFARHAKRKVICGADVKLLARRNSKLLCHLEEFQKSFIKERNEKRSAKKRKHPEAGGDHADAVPPAVCNSDSLIEELKAIPPEMWDAQPEEDVVME